jgi:penicillin-binding protein 2
MARAREAYIHWKDYMKQFGLDNRLGSDINFETKGNIPSPEFYDKMHNNKWGFTRVISLSIGQGEILITPLQMANVISAIANRGYYYTPHAIRAIDDKAAIPQKFKEKHKIKIDAANFEAVVEGMAGTMINGTAARTGIEGIEICGKTGTVQNPHGKNHSVFMCFAPKDNPKIAIACIVENAGFGATWAAPVATLMVEKYIKKDTATSRPELEKKLFNAYFLSKPKPVDSVRLKFYKDSIQKAKNDSLAKKKKRDEDRAGNFPVNREMVLNKRYERKEDY